MSYNKIIIYLIPVVLLVSCSKKGSEGKVSSPLTPEEQLQTFQLPDGFKVELVASDPDIANVVSISFDDKGQMWAVTAREYPMDGRAHPEAARLLYQKGGKDKVLVFDNPTAPGPHKPRVFVDSLALPMSVLPVGNDVIVAHGPEILRFSDTDGDGHADEKEVLLSGFGIQDSHLMPHGFTRGPGGWIYFAQGAFQRSNVKTKEGTVVEFNNCKIGRFKPDGSHFEIVGAGLNNIWGFAIDRHGEMFITEANDQGYPAVPFFIGANYPGLGMDKLKPYAPWQPPVFGKRTMGGTGLSGLAIANNLGTFPASYREAAFLANPITGKINAVRIHKEGTGYQMEKLHDFLESSDPMFRPVAFEPGPEGCLYIVDWYDKIISHAEVSRENPLRDHELGRIWRVCPDDLESRKIPDLTLVPEKALISHLKSENTWEANAARHQIVERSVTTLAPKLIETALSKNTSVDFRLQALWTLEGLRQVDLNLIEQLTQSKHRALRREAVWILEALNYPREDIHQMVEPLVEDNDPQVRAQVIRTLDRIKEPNYQTMELLARMGKKPLRGEIIRSVQGNYPIKTGKAGNRDFERYLVRAALEEDPELLYSFLKSNQAKNLSPENRMLVAMALEEQAQRRVLSDAVFVLNRPLIDEELVVLSKYLDNQSIYQEVKKQFSDPANQSVILEELLKVDNRIKHRKKLRSLIAASGKELLSGSNSAKYEPTVIRLVSLFKVFQLEPELIAIAGSDSKSVEERVNALKALREINSDEYMLFRRLISDGLINGQIQQEALRALTASDEKKIQLSVLGLWPDLNIQLRNIALNQLSSSKQGGSVLLSGVEEGVIKTNDLEGEVVDRLLFYYRDNPRWDETLDRLSGGLQSVLHLTDDRRDYVDTNLDLEGPFTVETWIKVESWPTRRVNPRFYGNTGFLGNPASGTFDFEDGHVRVYGGPKYGERIVSTKAITPGVWTHLAVTRNKKGEFRIYINGELDNDESEPLEKKFTDLDIGRASLRIGLRCMLTEFRIWNYSRTASEIRNSFDRSFEDETALPKGLIHYYSGEGPWGGTLIREAKIVSTADYPPILTAEEAEELQEKFNQYKKYAQMEGDPSRGRAIFERTCMACHSIDNKGASTGPPLDDIGYINLNTILRSILTPNAAIASGYERFRVETVSGQIYVGFLVSRDNSAIVLRRQGMSDITIPKDEVKEVVFTRNSIMPKGLLKGLSQQEVTDLFKYFNTIE